MADRHIRRIRAGFRNRPARIDKSGYDGNRRRNRIVTSQIIAGRTGDDRSGLILNQEVLFAGDEHLINLRHHITIQVIDQGIYPVNRNAVGTKGSAHIIRCRHHQCTAGVIGDHSKYIRDIGQEGVCGQEGIVVTVLHHLYGVIQIAGGEEFAALFQVQHQGGLVLTTVFIDKRESYGKTAYIGIGRCKIGRSISIIIKSTIRRRTDRKSSAGSVGVVNHSCKIQPSRS